MGSSRSRLVYGRSPDLRQGASCSTVGRPAQRREFRASPRLKVRLRRGDGPFATVVHQGLLQAADGAR